MKQCVLFYSHVTEGGCDELNDVGLNQNRKQCAL